MKEVHHGLIPKKRTYVFKTYICITSHTWSGMFFLLVGVSVLFLSNLYVYMNVYVCVCMHVCMYVCMFLSFKSVCIYVCVCMHACMHVWMYVCVCMYGCMDVWMYVCMCVCVWMYVCIYVCVWMYVCVRYMYIYLTHTHIYIQFTPLCRRVSLPDVSRRLLQNSTTFLTCTISSGEFVPLVNMFCNSYHISVTFMKNR